MKAKKNNKGFSLVELIVVILIMAILAVALTPQVLKWVKNARIANDRALMDTLVGNCQIALANEAALKDVTDCGGIKIVVHGKSDTTIKNVTGTVSDQTGAFPQKLAEISGYAKSTTGVSDFIAATETQVEANYIIIQIATNGKVTGKYTSDSSGTTSVNIDD